MKLPILFGQASNLIVDGWCTLNEFNKMRFHKIRRRIMRMDVNLQHGQQQQSIRTKQL